MFPNFYDPSYIRMFPLHTLGSQLKGNFSIHCSVAIICIIRVLLHTLNSTLYFVIFRTEDDRRTVETCF